MRNCKKCGFDKPFVPGHWRIIGGQPVGNYCEPCHKVRQRELSREAKALRVAARSQGTASLSTATLPAEARTGTKVHVDGERRPGELPLRQLEVAKALREGAETLNANARMILDRVVHYANTPESTHHEWALKLLADRILPAKLFNEIGMQAAGIKRGDAQARPSVNITITAAQPDGVGGGTPAFTLVEVDGNESAASLDDIM